MAGRASYHISLYRYILWQFRSSYALLLLRQRHIYQRLTWTLNIHVNFLLCSPVRWISLRKRLPHSRSWFKHFLIRLYHVRYCAFSILAISNFWSFQVPLPSVQRGRFSCLRQSFWTVSLWLLTLYTTSI